MNLPFRSSLFLMLALMACTSDNQSVEPKGPSFPMDMLSHRWEVDRAFRNGRSAASLDGLFFDFSTKGSLQTNLIGQGVAEPFKMVGDSIKTLGSASLYFVVTSIDSSELVLETNLQATPFRFQLKKGKIDEQEIE